MKIKVCGITALQQLNELRDIGIDYAGLIFASSSPRYAGEKLKGTITQVKACDINKVGVFVNEQMETIMSTAEDYGLNAVQLHGDEDPEFTAELNKRIPVIKAFRISGQHQADGLIGAFADACTWFLFDTYEGTGAYGGTGRSFDWSVLKSADIRKPFFLSGGISPAHIPAVLEFEHPSLFAIDVNSRFEISPGIKDVKAVRSLKTDIMNHNVREQL